MNASTLVLISVIAAAAGCASHPSGSPSPQGADAWVDSFEVKRSDLGPTGTNPYFDLTPGNVWVYRDGAVTLTITVLDQTRVLDGVTTRVVEEREEKGGQTREVSRNFFAIDRPTGNLYYFGEEVDLYTDGRVSGHSGSWLAGVSGARFGLALPARPRLGQRYSQEVAPGVAMDRGEIVGMDDTIETPAGTFAHCLHVRETTPLESDVGQKWYAPGVGLVQDDDLVLTASPPRKR